MFLKISQNLQENICVSLIFNKLLSLTCNFIKKEALAQVFSCEFCEISKNTFFTEHVWATASVSCFNKLKYSTFPGKNISEIKHTLPGSI